MYENVKRLGSWFYKEFKSKYEQKCEHNTRQAIRNLLFLPLQTDGTILPRLLPLPRALFRGLCDIIIPWGIACHLFTDSVTVCHNTA